MFSTRCLTLCLLATASVTLAAPADEAFDSYTKAYHQADAQDRPMLVILNPGQGDSARLNIADMKADSEFAGQLSDYVVAEIDTTTAHGQKVHELFKSPSLPHVVVIDSAQKKQLYKTSRSLTATELADVLSTYRDGAPTTVTAAKPVITESAIQTVPSTTFRSAPLTIQSSPSYAPPADCPACRRAQQYRF